MYQRLSAHISSVDIPDFSDLKETARETATRVETAFLARSSSTASTASLERQQLARSASVKEEPEEEKATPSAKIAFDAVRGESRETINEE